MERGWPTVHISPPAFQSEQPSPRAITPRDDKIIRMMIQTAALEAGRFHIPQSAPWLPDFLDELAEFPAGRYDDQIDSPSQFLKWATRYGGLKPAVGRQLQRIAAGLAAGDRVTIKAASKLKPGARLAREWNGATHVVEVVGDGFIWNGERRASLSAIARAITGAHWSGPRFFGLVDKI